MTFITIAIPTFNNEKTIARAIESCLNQSDLSETKILVINNASTDGTAGAVEKYKEQIDIITNPTTVSLFENHNIALRSAKSQYVLFCHSDDTLKADAIKIIKKNIEYRGNPTKYICWGHSMFRDFYPVLQNSKFTTGQMFAGIYSVNPFLQGGLTPSGTVYSSEFIEIGGFLPVQHRLAPSDSSSMVNAGLRGFKFEMIQDIILERTDGSTMTREIKESDKFIGYSNAYENLLGIVGKDEFARLLTSSAFVINPPIRFYRFNAHIYPRLVLKRLLKACVKTPKILFDLNCYYAIIISLTRLIGTKKSINTKKSSAT